MRFSSASGGRFSSAHRRRGWRVPRCAPLWRWTYVGPCSLHPVLSGTHEHYRWSGRFMETAGVIKRLCKEKVVMSGCRKDRKKKRLKHVTLTFWWFILTYCCRNSKSKLHAVPSHSLHTGGCSVMRHVFLRVTARCKIVRASGEMGLGEQHSKSLSVTRIKKIGA